MKIQCNVCEAAEANVLCCADEAALCWICDQKVHAANKLASKHQRVPLSTSSAQMPKCDICQETVGYFFCLEDRALLCRKCDVAIHTVNSLVSVHQRFLLTGVKVGLEATVSAPLSAKVHSPQTTDKIPDSHSLSKKSSAALPTVEHGRSLLSQRSTVEDFSSSKVPFNGASPAGSMSQWQLDDYLSLGDFGQSLTFLDTSSSKGDSGKLVGESESSQLLQVADAELEGDDCFGQVPDSFWVVPQIQSPPTTASGLYWPKDSQIPSHSPVFVPDVVVSPRLQNLGHHHHSTGRASTRRHC
ncbi:B-box zinc finger protein 22 [Andrographis paniculata]|uniref:B-box zinc finger protein 22 n=1 Tax=Andrographis paniculata TaxID=175694 RepID=UPI0021E7B75B|nr:B-box zinc finger protein 22 [Andrographis paniculata]